MILSNLSPVGLIGIYPYIFNEVIVFNTFENKYLAAFLPETLPNTTQSNKELPSENDKKINYKLIFKQYKNNFLNLIIPPNLFFPWTPPQTSPVASARLFKIKLFYFDFIYWKIKITIIKRIKNNT